MHLTSRTLVTKGVSLMGTVRHFDPLSDSGGVESLLRDYDLHLEGYDYSLLSPADTFVAVKDFEIVGIIGMVHGARLGFIMFYATNPIIKNTHLPLLLFLKIEKRANELGLFQMLAVTAKDSGLTQHILKTIGAIEGQYHKHLRIPIPSNLSDKLRRRYGF